MWYLLVQYYWTRHVAARRCPPLLRAVIVLNIERYIHTDNLWNPDSFNTITGPLLCPRPRKGGGGIRRSSASVRPSVCLSDVAYIGSNSKTKRPRKTKLCTGVPQVTCDSHTDFKVKSQGGAGAYCGGDLAAQLVHDVLPSTVQFAFIYDILHRSCTWWYITQFVVNCLLLNGNLCGTLWIWNDCSLLISRLWISIVHIFFCYWCVS